MNKKGHISNIKKETKENNNFRKVLYTAKHSQLVVMSLKPGEEIGEEVHNELDQFVRIEQGKGKAVINNQEYDIEDDWAVIVPAGALHNFINTGEEDMKLYTIYSPPEHKHGTIHPTKADVEEEHFDGETSE